MELGYRPQIIRHMFGAGFGAVLLKTTMSSVKFMNEMDEYECAVRTMPNEGVPLSRPSRSVQALHRSLLAMYPHRLQSPMT